MVLVPSRVLEWAHRAPPSPLMIFPLSIRMLARLLEMAVVQVLVVLVVVLVRLLEWVWSPRC